MDGILVVDYGSQYTMLIARRLRSLGVFCQIAPHDSSAGILPEAAGIILSGGPASVMKGDAPVLDPALLSREVPILGICYGMHLLVRQFGGQIESQAVGKEYGPAEVDCGLPESWLQQALGSTRFKAWMSHGDHVSSLAPDFEVCARTAGAAKAVAAIANAKDRLYGLQFHPEVGHTEGGTILLAFFCERICGYRGKWTMPAFAAQIKKEIRAKIGSQRVLLALSGGIDSAVAATLIEQACPGQTQCVMVDNGLLRAQECEQVGAAFAHLAKRLHIINAADEFFAALAGIREPEQKRKIIGRLFIANFERFAKIIGPIPWLGQGTIYPDVIESAGGNSAAAAIKSHHNVGGLPAAMNFNLIEPLKTLFKDEVRQLGKELGLAAELLGRHPFPGPGLAVRVIGEVSKDRVATLRHADSIFLQELERAGLSATVAQAFAVLLPVATVGVMGDSRSYDSVVALRAVTSEDFMTADWARLPAALLSACASRIANEVEGVSRVVYDISSKPPATIEWE